MVPKEAFELLLAGNQRFVAGPPEHPNQDATLRAEIAPGQRPSYRTAVPRW
jgi:carbonic anhydrase